MKTATIAMVGLLMLAVGFSAQTAPSFSVRNGGTFTGEVTDSICAEGHHIDVTKSEKNCILRCVKLGGAHFVLYSFNTKRTYKLDNQQLAEAFAGQEVIVTGMYDEDTKAIHVINVRPKITYAGL